MQASQTEFPSLLGPCPIARKDCRARPADAPAAPDSMRDAHNSYTQSRGIPNNRVGHYPDRHTSRPTGAPATTSHRYRHCSRWWQVGTEQVRPDDGASISHLRLADTLQPPDRAHRTGRRMSAFGGVFDPLRHAAHHEPRMTSFGARVRWQRKPRPGRVNKSAAARRHRLEKCHPETRGSTDCDPLALRGQDDFSNPPSWTMSNTRRSRSDAPTTVIFASLFAS